MTSAYFDSRVRSVRVSRHFRITARPTERTNMYLQAYEKGPCLCCGARDHALMSTARTRSRFRGRTYLCPVAVTRELYPAPQTFMCVDYYPCPRKFAEVSNYNFERAEGRMRKLLTRGAGRRMTFPQWKIFWKEVKLSCEARNAEHSSDQIHC